MAIMAVVIVIVNRTSFGSVKEDRRTTCLPIFARVSGSKWEAGAIFWSPSLSTFDNLYYTPRGQGRVATKMSI